MTKPTTITKNAALARIRSRARVYDLRLRVSRGGRREPAKGTLYFVKITRARERFPLIVTEDVGDLAQAMGLLRQGEEVEA
jgi:hypothetical protein